LIEGTAVTAMAKPKTIHDFYGFPDELYSVKYPAPGSAEYAKLVQETIARVRVSTDQEWGLDHGTWSVLVHMYPKANIPVLQLSLNYNLSFEQQYQVGVELKKLRDQGVLILGSGNLVHNLMRLNFESAPYPWAVAFDTFVKDRLKKKDHQALINVLDQENFRLAHPTYEHYLPLLYVLGASDQEDPWFINESLYAGSLSMRCAIFG
jgi:4,5-DOPA dioxygenase extradiol